jgi:glycosyltransferase involved in cell wall biosynthesis
MQQLVKFYKLEENIEFCGYQENKKINSYLLATKLYVHPALTEMWPNAVLEALCLQTPVICSDAGGLPELMGNGKFGHIVPTGDAKALAYAIGKYLKNKSDLATLKDKAKMAADFIKENYTLENQVNQMLDLYNKSFLFSKAQKE